MNTETQYVIAGAYEALIFRKLKENNQMLCIAESQFDTQSVERLNIERDTLKQDLSLHKEAEEIYTNSMVMLQ